jgi:peptidoglycan-associated lipoprotein
MRKTSRNGALVVVIAGLVTSLLLWGCPKRPEEATMSEAQKPAGEASKEAAQPAPAEVKAVPAERAAMAAGGLQPVFFDFDRSVIREDSRDDLTANADWLKANPAVKVRIEGNCDERGTIEYNQALGQRRASAAKKYLMDLGVSAGRITLVSYGKEKPVCTESTEDCWQKNRKDDFIAVSE